MMLHVRDRGFGLADRGVDVFQRMMLQFFYGRIVLLAIDILMHLTKQLESTVQSAGMAWWQIYSRVIV